MAKTKNPAAAALGRLGGFEGRQGEGKHWLLKMKNRNADWSEAEVTAAVADYFEMLSLERKSKEYNKTEHRHRLMKQLKGRSDGSVERKHQNISAVLQEMGLPFIDGYKPLKNLQMGLRPVVEEYAKRHAAIFEI